jgi:hypothetical protein
VGRLTALLAGATAACTLALPAVAAAQAPADIKVRVGAHLYPRPWGLTYVYGYVRLPTGVDGAIRRDRPVTLERSLWPFTTWEAVATGRTGYNGYFSFRRWNVLFNEQFRATVQLDSGAYLSQDLLLHVPFRPRIAVTAKPGKATALVTVSGTVRPARPGKTVAVQSLGTGGWHTVTRATLAGEGALSSFQSRRMRIKRIATYRLRMGSDALNSVGYSGQRVVRFEPKKKR